DQNSLFLLQNNSILLLLGIIGMTPLVSKGMKCFFEKAAYWKAAIFFLLETGYIILVLSYLVTETYNPFLYFRF
ncbi:MAG: MBOAT family protein, partial [Clostridiales bacterium]|nr:MBOAT family protein [Clostridiales bacterium]